MHMKNRTKKRIWSVVRNSLVALILTVAYVAVITGISLGVKYGLSACGDNKFVILGVSIVLLSSVFAYFYNMSSDILPTFDGGDE